jgi:transposase
VRLPKCSAESFHKKVADRLPGELAAALKDIVATIASLTERIRDYERRIERVCKERYPEEAGLLRQVAGVGPLTSLTFVLTLEDPDRFKKSRVVGAYLGLVPGKDQSGESDPGKRISGEGDKMLRVGSWSQALTTSWDHLAQTLIYDATARRSPDVAVKTPKNEL